MAIRKSQTHAGSKLAHPPFSPPPFPPNSIQSWENAQITSASCAFYVQYHTKSLAALPSENRQGETNAGATFGAQERFDHGEKTKLRRTRNEKTNCKQTHGRGEERKDREAHLSFCTSAVRHPGDRSTLSVRRHSPPSPAARLFEHSRRSTTWHRTYLRWHNIY